MNVEAHNGFPRRVLVVDRDARLRRQIASYLGSSGYDVETASSAAAMEKTLEAAHYSLVLLDVRLPDMDGHSACVRLQDRASGPSIMVMGEGDDAEEHILYLELGADDYVRKPIEMRELLARVRALLRRRGHGRGLATVMEFGGFRLDVVRRQLRAPNGEMTELRPMELKVLAALLQHPGKVLSRESLVELVRGEEADVLDRAIDTQVSRLRRKLNAHTGTDIIRTLYGLGYTLEWAPA